MSTEVVLPTPVTVLRCEPSVAAVGTRTGLEAVRNDPVVDTGVAAADRKDDGCVDDDGGAAAAGSSVSPTSAVESGKAIPPPAPAPAPVPAPAPDPAALPSV